jgi:hypothetical protein
MGQNSKRSSSALTSLAAEVLKDGSASSIAKSLAGSVLSQADSSKQTGVDLEDKAAKVLQSDKYSDTTRKLAASVLAQSNKER